MELSAGLKGEGMSSLDRYIAQVSRHLVGLSTSVREDVLMELRSHILAQAETEGTGVDATISKMGSPRETARSYVSLYGYGLGARIVAIAAAAFVAFLTLPFTFGTSAFLGTDFLASASLILLILLLVIVGVKVGGKTALMAGSGAAIVRFGALGFAYASATSSLLREPLAILTFALTTVVLVFVGYLAAPKEKASPD